MIRKLLQRLFAPVLAAGLLLCAAVPAGAAGEAAAGLELTPEEQAYIDACGTLKVGYVQDRIPISFTDETGQLAGVSRYIFDRIQQLSGLTFEYVALPGGDVTYDYLLSEGFDLVTSVEYNEENKKANGILISEPYLSSRKVVVARSGLDFDLSSELDVAISTGSQTLRKVLTDTYPNFRTKDYPSISACFDAVRSGAADLLIQNQYVVEYWMGRPAYERMKVIPVLNMDDLLCFSAVVAFDGSEGVPPEEGRTLIDILDKTIALMTEDEVGSYIIQAVMANPYSYTMSDFLYRYRYAVTAVTLSALVILAMVLMLLRQRVRAMADQAEAKAKGQFLSTMSHEIRTPLNGLIGLNYLMSQKLDDPERLRVYLRQSSATAEYLRGLVDDILDMSSLQDNELELVLRPVDLHLLVSTVVSIVRGSMAEKKLDFQVSAAISCPCVMGDDTRIQQVLLNLLDNARKFTPEGGHVSLRVDQVLSPEGSVVTRAEVTDDGRGMSEPFQKRVFDSFAQELDTVSKGNQGTGLGLPISRHLARLMGGDLTFTSKKDEGSTFIFTFPGQPAAMPEEKPAPAAKPRVLVAEDNELNGEIMLDLLEGSGYETALVSNGREAVELFQRFDPGTFGVILMDLLMPEMDGFQATAAIRALDRPDAASVKIIACTANASDKDREKALASGMNGFLTKPVDLEKLLKALSDL